MSKDKANIPEASQCPGQLSSAPVEEATSLSAVEHIAEVPVTTSFDPTTVVLVGKEDPKNWSSARKWSLVAIISLMGFISPLGSSVVVPGSLFLDIHFHLHSRELSLLPVSFFVLGLGLGPFLLAPASELKGRQPIYLYSSIIFVLFNIGTALVDSFAGLNVLRFLAGAAGSAGPSLGAGSIGDLFSPTERGRAQSLYGLGPLLGPVCGTIAGGWIAQELKDWRWLLWILTILSGAITVIVAIFLRETYGPVLVRKKRDKLAKEHLKNIETLASRHLLDPTAVAVERSQLSAIVSHDTVLAISTTTTSPVSRRIRAYASRFIHFLAPSPELRKKTMLALSRPFRLLFTNPICAIFSLYMGYIYGIIFLFLTQHPLLFQRRESPDSPPPDRLPTYGWETGIASLTYLGLGLGFISAATINVLLQDSIYCRLVLSEGKLGLFLFSLHRDDVRKKMVESKGGKQAAVAESKGISNQMSDAERGATAAFSKMDTLIEGGKRAEASSSAVLAIAAAQAPSLKGRPEFRLPLCLVGMIILPCGLFVFGWSAESKAHFMLPLLGSYLVGMGAILPFQSILVYLVDAFIPFSASATACAVLVRNILAAVFPLFSQQLFVKCGYGWGSSILAFVSLLAIPVPIVLYKRGEALRARFKFNG